MANKIITTLHPKTDENTDLYPNIVKENIPVDAIDSSKVADGSISKVKLDDELNNLLDNIGQLNPSGVDLSTNILAFTTNKGIYIGLDTGHWYFWNGVQYVDGGVYISTINFKCIIKHIL